VKTFEPERVGVLFVCLGNICRSPMAEGVFAHLAREHGVADRFAVDSCGTSTWHAGEPAHAVARETARKNGFDIDAHIARQVTPADFGKFHYILAMDRANLRHLEGLAPAGSRPTLDLLLRHVGLEPPEVPDPYYGGSEGFQTCLDLIARGAEGLLRQIENTHFA
jgi:low molecular weight protein-tyrosine phosphatase